MKKRVLQHGRLTPGFEALLAAEFDLCPLWQEANQADYLAKHGREYVGLVTSGVVGADAAMLDALPALQVIANRGVGCDKIDLEVARRRGIVVSNTPGVLTDCGADLAIGAMIAGAALDVFEKEPKVPDSLLVLENVVLLPHIASGTTETFAAMENLALENLRSFFRCGRLLTPVC